jgi:hypothetical protein
VGDTIYVHSLAASSTVHFVNINVVQLKFRFVICIFCDIFNSDSALYTI